MDELKYNLSKINAKNVITYILFALLFIFSVFDLKGQTIDRKSGNKIVLKSEGSVSGKISRSFLGNVPVSIFVTTTSDSLSAWIEKAEGQKIQCPEYIYDLPLGIDIQNDKNIDALRIPVIRKAGFKGDRKIFRVLFLPVLQKFGEYTDLVIEGSELDFTDDPGSALEKTTYSFEKKGDNSFKKIFSDSNSMQVPNSIKKLKIFVKNEGIYQITGKDLEDAGWNLKEINPDYLKLSNLGKEVPVLIRRSGKGSFKEDDKIIFYGEALSDVDINNPRMLTVFASSNVYILEVSKSKGLRYAQESCWIRTEIPGHFSFPYTEKFRNNGVFFRFGHANFLEPEDHYVYSSIIYGKEKWDTQIQLTEPDVWSTSYVKFEMALRGNAVDQNKKYDVDVYLNNHLICSGEWNGSNLSIIQSADFSPAFLSETGENNLNVINRAEDAELSPVFVDWLEITYPRLFKANNDYLRFSPPENSVGKRIKFTIENFTAPEILLFKKDISHIEGGIVKSVIDSLENLTYSVSFEDSIVSSGTEYIAVSEKGIFSPDSIKNIPFPGSFYFANRAKNIIIIPVDSFMTDIERLVRFRETKNIKSAVIRLCDIYNEFGYGIPGPEPIQKFLSWAYRTWKPAPETVLLVGSGTYNRKKMSEGNLIPAPIYHTTKFGGAASDNVYALLDGNDNSPDIAVGRFPVVNLSELENIVDKTIEYWQHEKEPWQNKYCLIAAGGHSNAFLEQTEEFIHRDINHSLSPIRHYLTTAKGVRYLKDTEDLLAAFNSGLFYVNFRGHGGGAVWSDGRTFTLEDVPLLKNKDKYPIITSMTCFTADYSSSRSCLGKSLLVSREKGAVGFWGATGVGWIWNDYFLLTEFFNIFNKKPEMSAARLFMTAKRNLLKKYSGSIAVSDVYQYTYLGDPCLSFCMPKDTADADLLVRAVSDTVRVIGNSKPGQNFINIEIAGDDFSACASFDTSVSTTNWSIQVPLPDSLKLNAKNGGVRIWQAAQGSDKSSNIFLPFSISTVYFDSIETVPARIIPNKKFKISILADAQNSVQEMWCKIISPDTDSSLMKIDKARRFITEKELGPYDYNAQVNIQFFIRDKNDTYKSDLFVIKVPGRPDLMVNGTGLKADDVVYLYADITNNGDLAADSVIVKFTNSDFNFSAYDTVSVGPYKTERSKVVFSPVPQKLGFEVFIDPGSLIEENNEDNNNKKFGLIPTVFNISPSKGTIAGGENDTVGINNVGFCYIPPGIPNQDNCLIINKYYDENTNTSAVKFSFIKDAQIPATVIINFDSSADKDKYTIYRLDRKSGQWIFCNTNRTGEFVYSKNVIIPGIFTAMSHTDEEPPCVEVQVNGQPFASGSYVPENPKISIILEDSSGVNFSTGKIQLVLDDGPVSISEITIPDTVADARRIPVMFNPVLDPGEHKIVVKAEDINGNFITTEPIILVVATKFQLKFLGNHPNPFSPYRENTIFAYTLTSTAEKVSLKIYTVAGRLLAKFEDPFMCGADYHEIEWDGCSSDGQKLANGVYFFILEAVSGKERETVRGKIAIIQ